MRDTVDFTITDSQKELIKTISLVLDKKLANPKKETNFHGEMQWLFLSYQIASCNLCAIFKVLKVKPLNTIVNVLLVEWRHKNQEWLWKTEKTFWPRGKMVYGNVKDAKIPARKRKKERKMTE